MTNDPELSEKISSEDDQGVDQPQPFSKFQLEVAVVRTRITQRTFPKFWEHLGFGSWNHADDKLVFTFKNLTSYLQKKSSRNESFSVLLQRYSIL